MILHDTGFDDHISSSHNTCKCSEVSSDIEGVKLDITILESTVKQQANTLARMQEVMANLGTATTEAKSIPSDQLTPNSTSGERGMQCKNNSSIASVITPTRLRYSDEPKQNNTDGVVVTLVNKYLPSQSKSNSKSRLNNAPILENSCYDPHHNSKGMQGQLNTAQTIGKECVKINQRYNKNKGKHKKHNTYWPDTTEINLDDHNTSNGRIIIDDTTPLQVLSRQSRRESNTAHSITPLNNYESIPTRIT